MRASFPVSDFGFSIGCDVMIAILLISDLGGSVAARVAPILVGVGGSCGSAAAQSYWRDFVSELESHVLLLYKHSFLSTNNVSNLPINIEATSQIFVVCFKLSRLQTHKPTAIREPEVVASSRMT